MDKDEYVALVDEDDRVTGEVVPREEISKHNLWFRRTAIFLIDEEHRFCVSKRSMAKEYCPGCLDLAFGGIVNASEINDVDLSAKREAEEETGLPDLS